MVARGQALARASRGERDDAMENMLERLREEALRAGLNASLAALEAAP